MCFYLKSLDNNDKANNIKNIKNIILAILAAPAATPPKPNTAAINAITKNVIVHRNIMFGFKV